MTYAPQSYKDAQTYICARTGLSPISVGLVGDSAHGTSGYHLGWDRVRLGKGLQDYSYRESAHDRARVTNASAAIDVGWFSVKVGARTVTLIDFSLWLIGQCRAGASDTLWIREVIYTPDRKSVSRWDRLGIRSGGDDSHLTHTHISGFRDAEDTPKRPLFERFFTATAGGTPSTPTGADLMSVEALYSGMFFGGPSCGRPSRNPRVELPNTTPTGGWKNDIFSQLNELRTSVDQIAAQPAGEVTMTTADRDAIVAGVVGGLVTNTAFLAAVAKAVADENARRQQA